MTREDGKGEERGGGEIEEERGKRREGGGEMEEERGHHLISVVCQDFLL